MKKKIALVTGGYSGEAVISYKSAENIAQHLDAGVYDVYVIDIAQDGWSYTDKDGHKQQVLKADFSITEREQKITFDQALMCIHGTPGEDGKLLGYFDMIGLPYTGCNAAVSALTFNKRNTIAVVSAAGIKVAKSILWYHHDPIDMEAIKALPFPIFVKPNNGGSSIGMTKIEEKDDQQITEALQRAFAEDSQVLIEEFIEGREFTVGVMRNQQGDIISLPMTEIILKKGRATFDFEAKYNGETAEITPAMATDEMAEKIATEAKKIYHILNCSGIVRIDFIYDIKTNQAYMLEVNTVPGQTKESLVPKQVIANGWTLTAFYTQLLLVK